MPQGPFTSPFNAEAQVKPPAGLRWQYGQWQGVISALSPQTLVLEGVLPIDLPPEAVDVNVTLASGKGYALRGQLARGVDADQLLFGVIDEHGREQIADLLGQIRKVQHIEICNREDVESADRGHGFQHLHFIPEALPELDESDLDTRAQFLGQTFGAPLLITGMTGGVELGAVINRRLAAVAQAMQIPMGVGSQRIACENPQYRHIFTVKDEFPDVFLIGNLGFAQILGPKGVALCQQAVGMIGADALAIHLNVLQECIQVEGDRHFKGALARLTEISKALTVPVIVKEVGCGISPATAKRLMEAGVAAVDIAGRGGTSWGYIEGLRSASPATMELATAFRQWGIPTAHALAALRAAQADLPVIATGGVRDGLMVAKACALGANLVGVGLPLLRAALQSEAAVAQVLATFLRGLKITMLATGSRNLSQLAPKLSYGEPLQASLQDFVRQRQVSSAASSSLM